jgi:hypothetical protein
LEEISIEDSLCQAKIAFEEMSMDIRTTNTKSTSVGTKEEPRLTNENRRNSLSEWPLRVFHASQNTKSSHPCII